MFGNIKSWIWKFKINPVIKQTNDQIMGHHISKEDCLGNVAT